jgi:hypothetical protein
MPLALAQADKDRVYIVFLEQRCIKAVTKALLFTDTISGGWMPPASRGPG